MTHTFEAHSRWTFRKTRLWLALTGWLPWACYFGRHDWVRIMRRNKRFLIDSRTGLTFRQESKRDGEFSTRLCVCHRCGIAL